MRVVWKLELGMRKAEGGKTEVEKMGRWEGEQSAKRMGHRAEGRRGKAASGLSEL